MIAECREITAKQVRNAYLGLPDFTKPAISWEDFVSAEISRLTRLGYNREWLLSKLYGKDDPDFPPQNTVGGCPKK